AQGRLEVGRLHGGHERPELTGRFGRRDDVGLRRGRRRARALGRGVRRRGGRGRRRGGLVVAASSERGRGGDEGEREGGVNELHDLLRGFRGGLDRTWTLHV